MSFIRKISELSQPSVEPLTLAELKQHLKISNTIDDTWLSAIISVARRNADFSKDRIKRQHGG